MFHDLYLHLNTNLSSVERKMEIFQQNITSCTLFDTFKVNYPVSGSKSVQYIKKNISSLFVWSTEPWWDGTKKIVSMFLLWLLLACSHSHAKALKYSFSSHLILFNHKSFLGKCWSVASFPKMEVEACFFFHPMSLNC